MEKLLIPEEPRLNRRARAKSWTGLDIEDFSSPTIQHNPIFLNRRSSCLGLQDNTTHDSPREFCPLEIIYKTTDIVLIICALIFIMAAITSVVLWLYGFPWGDLIKKDLPFKL